MLQQLQERIENCIYPELRAFGRSDRARLLQKASETPLDLIEWAGMLVGLVITASVTSYALPESGFVNRMVMFLINFLVAVPLLALTVGPFLLRRQKRGLRSLLN